MTVFLELKLSFPPLHAEKKKYLLENEAREDELLLSRLSSQEKGEVKSRFSAN